MFARLRTNAWMALTCLELISTFSGALSAEDNTIEISYIMEPFEQLDHVVFGGDNFQDTEDGWFFHAASSDGGWNFKARTTENSAFEDVDAGEALFGDSALRIDYEFQETIATTNGSMELGWTQLPGRPPHNCHGATYLSIWYKILPNSAPITRLRLVLLESGSSSNTGVQDDTTISGTSEEFYFDVNPDHQPLSSVNDWQEVRVSVSANLEDENNLFQPYTSSTSTNRGNNRQLDLHRLSGWRLELNVAADESDEPVSSGSILLDQLSFVGGGDLMGSSFFLGTETWQDAVRAESWVPEFYNSELSESDTKVVLQDGILSVDYTVEQVESWGGFVSFEVIAPYRAYYNLTNANSLRLGYQVREMASVPGRTHMRLIMSDSSHLPCPNCTDFERWYNFNYILDLDETLREIHVPLKGSTDATPGTLQLTGWSGGSGNRQLDTDHIKGFALEFSLDSQGDIGSTTAGVIDLFGLSALVSHTNLSGAENSGKAVVETGLHFNAVSARFHRREFLGSQCQKTCNHDPYCLYALSNEKDCFTASNVEVADVEIAVTATLWDHYDAFWMDDVMKRGDFCEICDCRENDRAIDCQGRDLKIIPKTFKFEGLWEPVLLDLRNNSHLVILGTGALDDIAKSIEEVWLPKEMQFISQGSLDGLPKLTAVQIEESSGAKIPNVIMEPSAAFGEVCCSRGKQMELVAPTAGLTFCKMEVHRPGIDSRYLPFITFNNAHPLSIVTPQSDFMSEAAESAEKCAEYCSIANECNYFSYDARKENAEHQCILQITNGTGPLEVCCEEEHYADDTKILPGWTAGLPPRTRHSSDNARVLISPQNIVADPQNNYRPQFEVSLGSTPLRGAVWVEPTVASNSDVEVSFWPPRVVLYDSNSSATVTVWVAASALQIGSNSMNLVINNKVTSCDSAFMENSDRSASNSDNTVFIDVIVPEAKDDALSSAGITAVVLGSLAVIGLTILVYVECSRKHDDGMWMIEREELCFAEPPEIVGRGNFGLVLKAEYRGTTVAVKRAIPPKKSKVGRCSPGRFSLPEKPESSPSVENSGASLHSLAALASEDTTMSLKARLPVNAQAGKNEKAAWKKQRDNFIQEIKMLSKVRHPCITTVMGAIISSKSDPMLVMELMDHGSLYDVLHNETIPLEAETVLSILQDISQGMRFLHAASPHQIIHGDLKAQNILVDSRFRAKVADFGFFATDDNNRITGTPYWLAPELLRGESANTTSSDVYAFGIVVCEVLSRKEPYEGENPGETLLLVADKAVNKRPKIPEDTPAPVQAVITDCLVGNIEQRPSFDELDQRLRRVEAKSLEVVMYGGKRTRGATISLFDIFPIEVAEALRDGREVQATHKDMCTIFFSDIVGFTDISATLEPRKVASMLDRLYRKLDELSHKYDIYKVETIGDSYMAVSNLVKNQPHTHVKRIAQFAVDAIEAANSVHVDPEKPELGFVSIRVGFHSGQVVADVVGTRNPRYCLFGDTVNTASRMESTGEKNRIQCSKESAALLQLQCPEMPISPRGEILVKGKGTMKTFFVNEELTLPSGSLSARTTSATDIAGCSKDGLDCIAEFNSASFREDEDLSQAENGLFDPPTLE